ncbi:phosphotransferase [Deinococcus sp. HMF7604]|uniref:phosphotransferase enzyme family protein n=1 Tax=Deinococcus betulae TaxID=2873312 RepID=UPI001CC8F8C9|nr:phosphotransferase [Deinococcus betulae]MBZ9751167.1 phosphotransferase [Deinococcus betulae]
MNLAPLLAQFDLPPHTQAVRLSAHADVWALQLIDCRAVLKRTSLNHAPGIAAWSQALAQAGVQVLAPLPGPTVLLPEGAGDSSRWVLYPFVEGRRYQGLDQDLERAGALLGQIHAAGPDQTFDLPHLAAVRAFTASDLQALSDEVLEGLARAQLSTARPAALLAERQIQYLTGALPRAVSQPLPMVNCSWDHKAANLVYLPSGEPVLVDPDNAARMPRVYDLALTALSFHLDPSLHSGPAQLMTPAQWATFLRGYSQHIDLTPLEHQMWPDVLLCAWMDEALWQLSQVGDGWQDEAAREVWLELLTLPQPFALT